MHRCIGGVNSACPPRTPQYCAIVLLLLLRKLSHLGEAALAGVNARERASFKKTFPMKIVFIRCDFGISILYYQSVVMNTAAPKRDAPAADQ